MIVICTAALSAQQKYYSGYNENSGWWTSYVEFLFMADKNTDFDSQEFLELMKSKVQASDLWKNNKDCQFINKMTRDDSDIIERGLKLMDSEDGEVYSFLIIDDSGTRFYIYAIGDDIEYYIGCWTKTILRAK
jgi:hypothetical protein